MSLILYGSKTSPYVRRVRMFLGANPYQFSEINLLDPEQIKHFKLINPIMKIPVLKHNDLTLYESRIIHRYLQEYFGKQRLTWEEENNLSLVDGALDSLINLFLFKRSGLDIETSDYSYVLRQKERIEETLNILESKCKEGEFQGWNFVEQSLYSFLDWASFRELFGSSWFSQHPSLDQWMKDKKSGPYVEETSPRI